LHGLTEVDTSELFPVQEMIGKIALPLETADGDQIFSCVGLDGPESWVLDWVQEIELENTISLFYHYLYLYRGLASLAHPAGDGSAGNVPAEGLASGL
jgi:hypothetical protein